MARYIKANQKVAQYLHLENDRNRVSDGNYLLWQADMLAFGPLFELSATLAMIGAIVLSSHEAKEEQDGTTVRELPVATDPRFIVEKVEETEEEQETEPAEQQDGETEQEAEPVEQKDDEVEQDPEAGEESETDKTTE